MGAGAESCCCIPHLSLRPLHEVVPLEQEVVTAFQRLQLLWPLDKVQLKLLSWWNLNVSLCKTRVVDEHAVIQEWLLCTSLEQCE